MKLIVRPKTFIDLNSYIKKGADAFLFDIKDLSIRNADGFSMTVFKGMRELLGDKCEVFVNLDKNMMNGDLDYLKKTLIKLSTMNISGVFFYDLAVLNIVKENNIDIPLVFHQNFMLNNYETVNYYASKGINMINLSNEITCDEMVEIKSKTNIPIMVNIFGYQMMSFSKRNLVSNYFKYYTKPMLKSTYLIKDNSSDKAPYISEEKDGTIIYSFNILNGIMEVNKLKKAKIDYVILDENMLNHTNFMKTLEIYSEVIKKDVEDSWIRAKNLEIIKMYPNLDDGFFNKKTIYKVKL
jgi:putative protease